MRPHRKASSRRHRVQGKASGVGRGRVRCASASPAGRIDDEVFSSFLDETLDDLQNQAFDAIYLSLHGAGVTTKREDPEVELLRAMENSADGADRREFRPAASPTSFPTT